jgi:hypothetical protein
MRANQMKTVMALAGGFAMPACALLVGLLLAGCAAPPQAPTVITKTVVERVTLPPGLLTCAPEPAVGPMKMQSDVADYLVRLEEAGADCRDTVNSIATIENAPPPDGN